LNPCPAETKCIPVERTAVKANRQDVAPTLATFKSGAARTELPGKVADGPDAVDDNYRELFTALPEMHFDIEPGSLCHHGQRVMTETCMHSAPTGDPFMACHQPAAESTCRCCWSFSSMARERVYYDRLSAFIQLGVARDPNS
jgi:hypothetical protein